MKNISSSIDNLLDTDLLTKREEENGSKERKDPARNKPYCHARTFVPWNTMLKGTGSSIEIRGSKRKLRYTFT